MQSPVLKNILAAVVGYIVMFALLFVAFSVMWMVLGADGAFAPGTWDVSGAWIGTALLSGSSPRRLVDSSARSWRPTTTAS